MWFQVRDWIQWISISSPQNPLYQALLNWDRVGWLHCWQTLQLPHWGRDWGRGHSICLVVLWGSLPHQVHQGTHTWKGQMGYYIFANFKLINDCLTSSASALASASVCDTPIKFLKHSCSIPWQAEQTSLYTMYPRRMLHGNSTVSTYHRAG